MTPERGGSKLTFEQFLADPSVVVPEPEIGSLLKEFYGEGHIRRQLADLLARGGMEIGDRQEEFQRYLQIRRADLALGQLCRGVYLFGLSDPDRLLPGGYDLPFERIAVIGPPGRGKTTLTLCLEEVVAVIASCHYLDTFKGGEEDSVRAGGWGSGIKRDEYDFDFASRFIEQVRGAMESGKLLSVADTPGQVRAPTDWFYKFLVNRFDKVIVLGRAGDEVEEWIEPFREGGAEVFLRVLVSDYERVPRRILREWDLAMPSLTRRVDLLNPGALAVGERLLELGFNDLVEAGIIR